jgi:hypothetical protein
MTLSGLLRLIYEWSQSLLFGQPSKMMLILFLAVKKG